MNKVYLKFTLFIIGIAGLLIIGLIGFRLLTNFITEFQQGADPASIFRGHTLEVPGPLEALWVSTSPDEGELPSQVQLEEMISAYWLAWQSLGRAHLTDDLRDLKTYWAGSAYEQVLAGIISDEVTSITTRQHKLFLEYFSTDGSVVVLRDSNFTIQRTIEDYSISVQVSAEIIMTLDQGFWRIRQITLHYS